MKEAVAGNLTFDFLKLETGQELSFNEQGSEYALVILCGACRVSVSGEVFELRRSGVFDELPQALYVPAGMPFSITGITTSELGLCRGNAGKGGSILFMDRNEVKCRKVGTGDYERTVCDIIDSNMNCKHLIVGETFNGPAKWSSFPPHKHDSDHLPDEAKMEEIYFFKVDPPEGFGFQRLYSYDPEDDRAVVIKNNTIVHIPSGYHPVCVMPGCRLYYLWVLWGEKRVLAPFEDPTFRFIKKD